MFRYCDKRGNVFELLEEGPRLVFVAPQTTNEGDLPASSNASATGPLEKSLDSLTYMHLVSAFSAAIDNKVYHRELCNKCSGIITTLENGQQRRYILSDLSAERVALEDALYLCLVG